MPELTVNGDGATRRIGFSPGCSVREILESAELKVRSACRGNGACGLCLVKVETSDILPPNRTELLSLSLRQLESGMRLACQLMPETDLVVGLMSTAAALKWRDITPEETPFSPSVPSSGKGRYGLAVDLGTTHISLSLRDMVQGIRVSGRVGPNPQSSYGADVISRLTAAAESVKATESLADLVIDGIAGELQLMAARYGISTTDIDRVVIVGNTAMAVLLTCTDANALLSPENWTLPVKYRLADRAKTAVRFRIHPDALISVVPPMAGFVGSDLLAGVLATGLTAEPGGLIIDFGTNSEIALWDGETLRVTSAAGGPAFETNDTRCGMPAEQGAVHRIERLGETNEWHLDVIGGGSPQGVCGTGLVDLLALLRDGGEITATGCFTSLAGNGVTIHENSRNLILDKKDIDTFQRAKAAIGAGVAKLLSLAGMRPSEIRRLCVGGAFGRNLDVGHARRIGLLPDIANERIEICGNTALAGAERLLLSSEALIEYDSLRRKAILVNLAREADFDNLFLENLYLRPMAEIAE